MSTLAQPFALQPQQALLKVAEALAVSRDLPELFRELPGSLRPVGPFDFLSLVLHDPDQQALRLHVLESPQPDASGVVFELAGEEAGGDWVWRSPRPVVFADLTKEERFPQLVGLMRAQGVRSCCWLPLATPRRHLGALGLGSARETSPGEADLLRWEQATRHVAAAVENALRFQAEQADRRRTEAERDRLRLLLDISQAVASFDLDELSAAVAQCLRRIVRLPYISLAVYDAENRTLRLHARHFTEGKGLIREGHLAPAGDSPLGLAFARQEVIRLDAEEVARMPSEFARRLVEEGIRSICCVPLVAHNRVVGILSAANLAEGAFGPADVELLAQVARQVAPAVERAVAFHVAAGRGECLAEEKLYLEEEAHAVDPFDEIITASPALRAVRERLAIVAPTDAAVLIQGEPGTGKALIARALHERSGRRERPFVKVNCAAASPERMEEDLFGHEKETATEALSRKLGRVGVAHRGTLFLAEVGMVPLELQPKLLRVLQDQELERPGNPRPQRVDVRFVASTSQDLERLVTEQLFRRDFYYPLNVFPLTLPPLRERPEDVAPLAHYFAGKHARRLGKRIEVLPVDALEALARYPWPGNVRELEIRIEQAVLLSPGPELRVAVADLGPPARSTDASSLLVPLKVAEREHILRALEASNWVVGGPSGAAAKLGLNRTTLQSRMRKLGIARPR